MFSSTVASGDRLSDVQGMLSAYHHRRQLVRGPAIKGGGGAMCAPSKGGRVSPSPGFELSCCSRLGGLSGGGSYSWQTEPEQLSTSSQMLLQVAREGEGRRTSRGDVNSNSMVLAVTRSAERLRWLALDGEPMEGAERARSRLSRCASCAWAPSAAQMGSGQLRSYCRTAPSSQAHELSCEETCCHSHVYV